MIPFGPGRRPARRPGVHRRCSGLYNGGGGAMTLDDIRPGNRLYELATTRLDYRRHWRATFGLCADEADQRGIRHMGVRPEPLVQLLLRDHARRFPHQQREELERFRREMPNLVTGAQLAPRCVEHEAAKASDHDVPEIPVLDVDALEKRAGTILFSSLQKLRINGSGADPTSRP